MDNKTQKSQQKSLKEKISSLIIARGESSEGRGKSKIHIIMVLGKKKTTPGLKPPSRVSYHIKR